MAQACSTGLNHHWSDVVASCRSSTVLMSMFEAEANLSLLVVFGDAGTGKSRLAGVIGVKYTDGITDDVLWHRGASQRVSAMLALALAGMVRMRASRSMIRQSSKKTDFSARTISSVVIVMTIGESSGRCFAYSALDDDQDLIEPGVFFSWRLSLKRLNNAGQSYCYLKTFIGQTRASSILLNISDHASTNVSSLSV